MASLDEVTNALSQWSAESSLGQPITDGAITLLAIKGDWEGVEEGLRINARWRRALACGDDEAVAAVLFDAKGFTELG